MATHFSTLAQRIPWTEEPAGYSLSGHTESDTTEVTKQQQQHESVRPSVIPREPARLLCSLDFPGKDWVAIPFSMGSS